MTASAHGEPLDPLPSPTLHAVRHPSLLKPWSMDSSGGGDASRRSCHIYGAAAAAVAAIPRVAKLVWACMQHLPQRAAKISGTHTTGCAPPGGDAALAVCSLLPTHMQRSAS